MKIQFDPNLDFQKQAIESVAGVFEGQEICQTKFPVALLRYSRQMAFPTMGNNLGIGNRLKLLPEAELETDFNGLKQWQAGFKTIPRTPVLQEAQ